MLVETEYISAGCNCIYNSLELAPDFMLFGANNALAVYDLQEERVIHTLVAHHGKINCVRFVKNTIDNHRWVVTSGFNGAITLWRACGELGQENLSNFQFEEKLYNCISESSINVCDGIQINENRMLIGTVNSIGEVLIYKVDLQAWTMELFQQIDIKKSVALDFVFHQFEKEDDESIVFALGMDTGSVGIYSRLEPQPCGSGASSEKMFTSVCTLNKHEDWVRCITFVALENGEVLMASGGEDSFIAVWRFTKNKPEVDDEFEFQVHKFRDYRIVFDSIIMGHEGWINSLHWNPKGELLSCSSDQSTVIWQNLGDVWMEKSRFGVMGGQLPGGFGARFINNLTVSWGFQGAIQIWTKSDDDEWNVQPSITGHFAPVADLDYHPKGLYVITTSDDQTTRVHAPWGPSRWHEIARPQIHGHDLYAVKCIGNLIVSGAEEKILRAFQPTEIFVRNLDIISEISVDFEYAPSAFLPVLGLSNQSEAPPDSAVVADTSVEVRLDEDFIRAQTLWAEVSKLYGHVYEISCIATSKVDKLIASGSQASKPQFAAIILWDAEKWKNLGEFPFHKLNVTDMEFSPDGNKLLSVSRDRVWAVWNVIRATDESASKFSIQIADSGNFHTRALWVGTWAPSGNYFVTGARDKKLAFWKPSSKEVDKYEMDTVEVFEASVTAISVNPDGIVAVGLESGQILFYQYNSHAPDKEGKLKFLQKLNNSLAHHDVVKRLKFNPADKFQLASAGADHIVKIYNITPPP